MKVMLIFPDMNSFHSIKYHPGLASISSYLKSFGHEVKLEYVTSVDQFDRVVDHIINFGAEIVAFTSVESQFVYVEDLSIQIKKNHNCIIICGGPYVTLFPEVIKSADGLDGIFVGEGEYAFLELIENLQKKQDYLTTHNFCYYDEKSDKVVKNPLNPLIDNLETLPFPDRTIFDFQNDIDTHNFVLFYFNRGCPFKCAFCCNRALAKVYGMNSNKTRRRSVKSCMAEIREVVSNYKMRGFLYFGDDLFTHNKKWLHEFLDQYKKEFNLPFMCQTRSNIASNEMFAKLRDAGCTHVMMSIESGNDFIRNEVMNRGISKEQIYNSFKWAHQNDIKISGTCIIGLPYETKEMIEESIEVTAKTYTEFFGVNIFYPYKGTELRRVCEENGFLPENIDKIKERKESILNLPTISKEEILYYYNNWGRLVVSQRSLNYRIDYHIKLIPHAIFNKISQKSPKCAKVIKRIKNICLREV